MCPVHVATTQGVCRLHLQQASTALESMNPPQSLHKQARAGSASSGPLIQAQLRPASRPVLEPGSSLQDQCGGTSRRPTVVALPAECNLTGTRCSDDTLHSLCHGNSFVTSPDGSDQVLQSYHRITASALLPHTVEAT